MFRKAQQGFTVIELIITMGVIVVTITGLGLLVTAVYAIGKFLFGWWG